jgi:nucleoside 2-deoxyribosyltransferase
MNTAIYLAGPLFTAAEREWNERLAKALRMRGCRVVLPQKEAEAFIRPQGIDFGGIFASCLEQIRAADVVVAIFDGTDVDSGTAFECGYAYAIGKPIIGARTDLRSGGEENGLNAMLSRCCRQVVYVPALNTSEQLVESILAALPPAVSSSKAQGEYAKASITRPSY